MAFISYLREFGEHIKSQGPGGASAPAPANPPAAEPAPLPGDEQTMLDIYGPEYLKQYQETKAQAAYRASLPPDEQAALDNGGPEFLKSYQNNKASTDRAIAALERQAQAPAAPTAVHAAKDTVSSAPHAATGAVFPALQSVAGAASTVSGMLTPAPSSAFDVVSDIASSAVDKASQAYDTVSEAASDAYDTAAGAASKAYDAASGVYHAAAEAYDKGGVAGVAAAGISGVVDLENRAEHAVVEAGVGFAQEHGIISEDTAQTIMHAEETAAGVRSAAAGIAGGVVKSALDPVGTAKEMGQATSDAYSKAGGGVDGALAAVNTVNPAYHAMVAGYEAYQAAERGDYKAMGNYGAQALVNVAATVGVAMAGAAAADAVVEAAAEAGARGEGGREGGRAGGGGEDGGGEGGGGEDGGDGEGGGGEGGGEGAEDEEFDRISDANKTELEDSGWLKERLQNPQHRRQFMKWLEDNHRGMSNRGMKHKHLSPGSPEADQAFDRWAQTDQGRTALEREATEAQRIAEEEEERRQQIETETEEEREERVKHETAEAQARDLRAEELRARRGRRKPR